MTVYIYTILILRNYMSDNRDSCLYFSIFLLEIQDYINHQFQGERLFLLQIVKRVVPVEPTLYECVLLPCILPYGTI